MSMQLIHGDCLVEMALVAGLCLLHGGGLA